MKTFLWIAGVAAGLLTALYFVGRRAIAETETVDSDALTPAPGAKFVDTRSGRVHCIDIGEGPPVLLFHGSGRSISDWLEGTAQRLALRHRVIAFDCYGFGRSQRSAKFTYGYYLWVQEAIDLMDALAVDHVTIVGHSVGGMLALIAAAEHPDRVDHVVTVGTGIAIEPAQFLPAVPGIGELMMARQSRFGPAVSEANRAELEAAFRVRGTRSALLGYVRRQVTIDGLRAMRGVLGKARCPVLHISGSLDRNISPEAARRLARMTAGAFVLIEGATHMVHTDKPDELVTEIERFLAL